jgi:hypothetical protein
MPHGRGSRLLRLNTPAFTGMRGSGSYYREAWCLLPIVTRALSWLTRPEEARSVSAMNFTVASYNIHRGAGLDRRVNIERTADVLKEIDADLVGVQEVLRPQAD